MSKLQALWVEKYRPTTVDDYVFHDDRLTLAVHQMIADKSVPQLILAGHPGTGKTTLARLLIDHMGVDPSDVLTINASKERGIDTFRNKVDNFCQSMAMGSYKIVHLEEADRLTPEAQDSLKASMEEVSDSVRFIFTCNTVSRLAPAIRSRCQEFFFSSGDHDDIAEQMVEILMKEKVKFSLELVDTYVSAGFPDLRKVINMIQQNTINGVLKAPSTESVSGEYRFKVLECIEQDDWVEARKIICSSLSQGEWENFYTFMYNNLDKAPKFKNRDKWDEGILTIADHLYKHTFCADPEINAAAMIIRLGQI